MEADLLSNDKALLARFRQGEREALMLVWNHYHPLVHGLACRGFGSYRGFRSPCDVDDTVSGAFLAAFEEGCRQRYDGIIPFGSFLLGIGRNVMRRQIKKAAREPAIEPMPAQEQLDPGSTPEELVLKAEELEVLGRFPATLAHEEQDVFFGHYRDGLSEERLAVHLGRTRHVVRKCLHRVGRAFRRFLRDHGLAPDQVG
ncbi:MAG: sigma-70 family RNA polymerase sigma factor [Deltaproteobacteria bacterium]|nr:sigma-70 family RNA polymerase sigma factor [Deltaproteobacteria bacterium]